jgi:hypothetical protein
VLPDVLFSEEVLPHHLAVVRHLLNELNLADKEDEEAHASRGRRIDK